MHRVWIRFTLFKPLFDSHFAAVLGRHTINADRMIVISVSDSLGRFSSGRAKSHRQNDAHAHISDGAGQVRLFLGERLDTVVQSGIR
jgi:hypothetical protein